MENKGLKLFILIISIIVLLVNIFIEYNFSTKIATTIVAISLILMLYVNKR